MSSLNSLYIKAETLKTLVDVLAKKEGKESKGISLTISIGDEGNDYDQNVSAYVEQTKDQREAKKPRFYVGNGKTFWTDGTIQVPKKKTEETKTESAATTEDDADLPF